jgi:hypothetical protein
MSASSLQSRNRRLFIALTAIALFMAVWGGWYLQHFGLADESKTERVH